MRRTLFCVLLLCLLSLSLRELRADAAVANLQPTLIAERTAIVPGQPVWVGIHLRLAPGWHTYWANPGDSGLPAEVQWDLPEGWSAGALQWPLPAKQIEPGDIVAYGYDNEVLLMAELTPPPVGSATLTSPIPNSIELRAKVSWLACAKSCVPGSADLALTLPLAPAGKEAAPLSPEAALFQQFRAQLPRSDTPPFAVRWESHDTEWHLKSGPLPEGAQLDFYPLEPLAGHPAAIAPGALRIPNGSSGASDAATDRASGVAGVLVLEQGGQRTGWLVQPSAIRPVAANATPRSTPTSPAAPTLGLPRALLFGFLGGFILNLMPCVLPVIALKILGFLRQAGESRQRVFRLGAAFVGGIYAWFLALAVAMVAARALGHSLNWAFQFQNPGFVLGAMLFLLVFALNLLGVFEVWLPGTDRLAAASDREGYGGAFLHGVFATLLATPCTAPFLGSALGFALGQGGLVVVALFAAIATGMSLPYLLLTAQPAWMRWIPKPGTWMVRFKQAMGFLLLGTVVWLLGVYGSLHGSGVGSAQWLLLAVGAACWIFGTWFTPVASGVERTFASVAIVAILAAGFALGRPTAVEGWEPWSPERVAALRAEGKPIFVDFGAEWCTNCKYNERFVLSKASVREAMRGVTTLRADWTKGDPAITAELRRLGRGGVPVYLVYPAGKGEPELLPELLTESTVLEALQRARR
jgi:thiol:disulfide interchange protein DsbD